jgi:diguanylate cyclase (GGDEF)-like protein
MRLPIAWQALLLVGLPAAAIGVLGLWALTRGQTHGTILTILLAIQTAFVCASAGLLSWLWSRRISRRIATIDARLQELQDGQYDGHLPDRAGDEIGGLARRINSLSAEVSLRERRIGENALMDPLTGLPNRTLLTDRIRHAIRSSERAREPFCVMLLDLDRFKFINDTLGHAAGDLILREVSRRLRNTARDSDTVARLGGDEFVLLLPGSQAMAEEVAGRILQAMREPLRKGDQLIDIGGSMGIAVYPAHGEKEETLLRHADAAMYRAKRRQTGFEVYDGSEPGAQRSYLSMLGEMRKALDDGQFELYYQPKLDLHTGLIGGAEGLLRWNHPTRGQVPPGEFIPFAEQTGFMRQITRWVIRDGLRFSAELARARLNLRISINVTAGDIQERGFADDIAEIVRSLKVRSDGLCLEITESGVVSESEAALQTLQEISQMGIKLSVDDFGTGYSTLKQLQQLPVQELKIDRSFVLGILDNHGSETIVRSTIDLARHMGLRVVAEGVENVRQMRALAALGCHEVQGYFLAKPMRAGELVSWVQMRHALHASSREMYFEMLTGK